MDNRKLLDLLDKYLAGNLTAEEQKDFTAWYAAHAEDAGTEEKEHVSGQPELTEEYKDALFRSIKQEARNRRNIHTLNKWWIPAAAACLLIVLGIWILRTPQKH